HDRRMRRNAKTEFANHTFADGADIALGLCENQVGFERFQQVGIEIVEILALLADLQVDGRACLSRINTPARDSWQMRDRFREVALMTDPDKVGPVTEKGDEFSESREKTDYTHEVLRKSARREGLNCSGGHFQVDRWAD